MQTPPNTNTQITRIVLLSLKKKWKMVVSFFALALLYPLFEGIIAARVIMTLLILVVFVNILMAIYKALKKDSCT